MKKLIIILCLFILPSIIKAEKFNVAVLIYEGVYVLDFTGPIEVFTDTFLDDTTKAFNVFTISKTKETIKAHSGMQVIPDYAINDCPKIDILVIPGGNPSLVNDDPEYVKSLKFTAEKSISTMSVCTGAFIFAKTGLLNGLKATTWHGAQKKLQILYPEINVTKDRYTDNGKYLTTSGVSAGIDGSLYLVSKIYGKKIAEQTAKYMDYEYWK